MATYRIESKHSWSETEKLLRESFAKWRVARYVVEPNCLPRQLHAHLSKTERGVTVRFWMGDREVVLTSDDQARPVDNLKKLQLCIEDMRMIDRRGATSVMQSAYLQLAPPVKERDPFEVLGLRPGANKALIDAAFKARAQEAHPDKGGTAEAMAELNAARERALERAVA